MSGFVKLYTSMLRSTTWHKRPDRDVFITALLMAEPMELTEATPQLEPDSLSETGFEIPPGWYGFCETSGPGLLDAADVDPVEGMDALRRLGQPEMESRSQDFQGRRLVRVDGGYVVLNYAKYREKDSTSADRQRRYRMRCKQQKDAERYAVTSRDGITKSRDVTQAEAEAEADQDQPNKSCSRPEKEIQPERCVPAAKAAGTRACGAAGAPPPPHGKGSSASPGAGTAPASQDSQASPPGAKAPKPAKAQKPTGGRTRAPDGRPRTPAARPRRPLPAGWAPNDQHREQARELGVNVEAEAERFRNHAAAKGRMLVDWDAGFRIWLVDAPKFSGGHRGYRGGSARYPEPQPHDGPPIDVERKTF